MHTAITVIGSSLAMKHLILLMLGDTECAKYQTGRPSAIERKCHGCSRKFPVQHRLRGS